MKNQFLQLSSAYRHYSMMKATEVKSEDTELYRPKVDKKEGKR